MKIPFLVVLLILFSFFTHITIVILFYREHAESSWFINYIIIGFAFMMSLSSKRGAHASQDSTETQEDS